MKMEVNVVTFVREGRHDMSDKLHGCVQWHLGFCNSFIYTLLRDFAMFNNAYYIKL